MSKDFKYIGKSIVKHDVKEKATGKIKYAGDMKLDGMLYAKLLLSDVAHANIINIDTSKAEALPGVVRVFTHKDVPKNYYNSHKWFEGIDFPRDELILNEKARHVGDRIAAVVAKDMETVERALSLIEVEYEDLPVIASIDNAMKEDATKIHEDGNKAFEKSVQCGDSEKVIKEAKQVFEDVITTPKQHHAAMETHVCVAAEDHFGNITIWAPCQVVFQVQLIVAEALNMPVDNIRVIKSIMGGSFGGKGQPILEPICAFLAKETGAPVKLVTDRTQSIIGMRSRNASKIRVKTAVDSEGKILARDIDAQIDIGAYYTNGSAVPMAMAKKSFRMYKIDNQTFKGTSYFTNTVVGGACRGYGSPQIHAATEINIDNIARGLNMDPAEFRLKNFVDPYDKDPIGGPDLGNARVIDCVERGMEVFEWEKKRNRDKDKGRLVKGVGMACATHGNGYHGAFPDFITMSLRMTNDDRVILKSGIHDQGCGTVTTMQQIVAEVLDIHPEKVIAPQADTYLSPYDSAGTQASRVTFVCGGCAKKTAELAKEKLISKSAVILGCSEEKVVIEDGYIWNADNEESKFSFGEMIVKIQNKLEDDIEVTHTYKSPANPAVYAANFVEVEVDRFTGLVKVLDVLAVHDIGQAINRGFVEGQVQGGAHMSIGLALSEEIKIDSNGRVGTLNFSKYHVVNAPDMPDVRVELIEDGEDYGPFGAKSVGEVCAAATAPAIINAINNALDINITDLPATPERVLKALKEKKENL
ncbi:molybdopterin cofactor-binding domain-containing protein [Wukongibacter baidiensis]|uniref:xanthine dehydrogenase family protein molybdopterin-binding subunit n=1 Tax=Wukongibacter baidiensis TaxID=1723361 RepID=UPI003D7FAC6A